MFRPVNGSSTCDVSWLRVVCDGWEEGAMKHLAAVRRTVRDIETIDAELRLQAAMRRLIR
jgi:hypothetical protein